MQNTEEKTIQDCNSKVWPANIWLIGSFFQKDVSGRVSALYEIIFGLLIGTLPFWVGGIVLLVRDTPSSATADISIFLKYWLATRKTFERGELIIFAISFLAPAFWLVSHEPEGARTLPHKRPIATLSLIVIIVGITLFSLIQSGTTVDMPAIFSISLWLAASAIFIMYLALTYHGFRLPKPDLNEKDLTRSRDVFLDEYMKHRGGN